jgi:hypothetical protein
MKRQQGDVINLFLFFQNEVRKLKCVGRRRRDAFSSSCVGRGNRRKAHTSCRTASFCVLSTRHSLRIRRYIASNWKGFGRKRWWPNRCSIPEPAWKDWTKTTKNLGQDIRCPGRDSNRTSFEYESKRYRYANLLSLATQFISRAQMGLLSSSIKWPLRFCIA